MPGARRKRVLFALLTAVIVWIVVEAAAAAAIGILTGHWFSLAAWQQQRLLQLGAAGATEGGAQPAVPGWVQSAAIHPYVGFVEDPSISPWDITDFGYYESERPLFQRAPDKLVLGIFGGSFAYGFRESAMDDLVARLARDPRLAGREIVVTSTALGGYKQPQQLMALNYLLALGGQFDVVVNIDGFNEVALHDAENRGANVFPAYPRSWYFQTVGVGDAGLVERAAELLRLRKRIAASAALYSHAPLRSSFAANLLWLLTERAHQRSLVEAQERLVRYRVEGRRYVATGPAFDQSDDAALYAMLTDLWKQSSLQMARLCAANGIAYVHALQPNQYLEGSKVLSPEERRAAFRTNHPYRTGVVHGYPRLIEAGSDLSAAGVRFLDLTALYAGLPETLYVDDCCHVSAQGYRLLVPPLAEAILAELDRLGWPAEQPPRRQPSSR